MYEIKVLTTKLLKLIVIFFNKKAFQQAASMRTDFFTRIKRCLKQQGQYSDLNREPTVPHTVALPIELYYPYNKNYYSYSFFNYLKYNYIIKI